VSGLRGVTLTVRFLCELAMLAALAYWGFTVGDGASAWVLGIGAPLLAAVLWGAWVAPKARWPVPLPTRVVIELVLFGAAVGALAVAGRPLVAVVLAVAALRELGQVQPGLCPQPVRSSMVLPNCIDHHRNRVMPVTDKISILY
jgi:hypothetical protein